MSYSIVLVLNFECLIIFLIANVIGTPDVMPRESILVQMCMKEHTGVKLKEEVVWYDDACHKYRCYVRHGYYNIAAVSCRKPEVPPNATKCYEAIAPKRTARFPYCCPKMKCIIRKDGSKFIRVTGQLSEELRDEPCTDDEEFEFKIMSAREIDVSKLSDEDKLKMAVLVNEADIEPAVRILEPQEQVSIAAWLMWPLEAAFLAESEVLRIFKTRLETYVDEAAWRLTSG